MFNLSMLKKRKESFILQAKTTQGLYVEPCADLFNEWNYDNVLHLAREFKNYEPKWDAYHKPKDTEDMDILAWYVPMCDHSPAKGPGGFYGIHFDVGKMLCVAKDLKSGKIHKIEAWVEQYKGNQTIDDDELGNDNGEYSNWLVTLIVLVFWHEVCHAWVEDLMMLYYDEPLRSTGLTDSKLYKDKLKQSFPEEEALCNTNGLGMLRVFLQGRGDESKIIERIKKFMEAQGNGYKDFTDIKWYPPAECTLRNKMQGLLKEKYSVNKGTSSMARQPEIYRELRGYPVYLHGKKNGIENNVILPCSACSACEWSELSRTPCSDELSEDLDNI